MCLNSTLTLHCVNSLTRHNMDRILCISIKQKQNMVGLAQC